VSYVNSTTDGARAEQLVIYVQNQSADSIEIFNDIDSINIPKSASSAPSDMIHYDYGVSEKSKYVLVGSGECLKIESVLINDKQRHDLLAAKIADIPVKCKIRSSKDGTMVAKTLLIISPVWRIVQ
jgi:hypothetical protein